jgi:hypothetical protein
MWEALEVSHYRISYFLEEAQLGQVRARFLAYFEPFEPSILDQKLEKELFSLLKW